jgi:hypothetical protein
VYSVKAVMVLPANYHRQAVLDFSKSRVSVACAVVSGIILLLATGWLLVQFTNLVRPTALDGLRLRDLQTVTPDGGQSTVIPCQFIVDGIIAFAMAMLVHELVHGLFFWRFTGKRPTVGIKGVFVYVAVPSDVYLPRNQYLLVGLAPLVMLTLVGLVLLAIAPGVVAPIVILFVAMNAAGAAGDLTMIVRLLAYPSHTLMQDADTGVVVYGP